MPFYVYAWLTNLFYGIGTITGKLATKHQITNPWLLNFVWALLIALFIIPVSLWNGVGMPTHWGSLWIVSLMSMLAGTLYIWALYKHDVSVLSPLYSLRTAMGVILGVLLFREQLTYTQVLLITVICIAGIFVSLDEHLNIRSFFKKTIALALVAILSSALFAAATKYALQHNGFWEVTLWENILSVVLLVPTIPLFWRELKRMKVKSYGGVVASAFVSVFGAMTANIAYGSNVSITSAILAVPSSMIMAFLFSVFAPKLLEKHTMKVYAIRFAAATIMVVAALKLSS